MRGIYIFSITLVLVSRWLTVKKTLTSRAGSATLESKMRHILHPIFATLGSNLGISTLLEILQSCKLDDKVALFSDWYTPTHPPLGRNWITTIGGVSRNILKWAEMCLEGILKVSV